MIIYFNPHVGLSVVRPNKPNKTWVIKGIKNNKAAAIILFINFDWAFFIVSSSDVTIAFAKSRLLSTIAIVGPNIFT